ncbi:hypothetical protein FEM03_13650 [Phragmitibacter flavus]|uniref:Cytochrome c domain-containing protein n=1 Tax=Phragmitibacter flavus TaxID=2576071 RepID=A0A5R8KD48_9BACT|nr:cbb3-type cytochrome c oxidase subunit II [Phragmitibacter flavus]TLD70226.1 hypothetical protein FEM03_13650 [Phragmitibacter flavus]
MTNFPKFIYGLAFAFGLPWLLLVIIPALWGQKLAPLPYDQDRDGMTGAYPGGGIYRQGQLVYLREGCNQCHTQVIRPSFEGLTDGWKMGWGSDQTPQPKLVVRPSTARDYMHEPVAPLGIARNGPDLANVGYRIKDDKKLLQKLYAPQSLFPWSVMPAHRHLFKVQKIQGSGAAHALDLPKEFAPEKGYEVVPKPETLELVKYIKSLKKDEPIPGQVPQE